MANDAVPRWIGPLFVGALTVRVGVWLARAADIDNPVVAATFAIALAVGVTWAAVRAMRKRG